MKEVILKMQQEFDRAELRGDREALTRLLTDDFASIGPKGFVLEKTAWIGRHGQFKYQALDTSEVDVHLYDGAAIVRNVQRNRATYEGKEIALAVRVSQTWVRVESEWRLAGIQFSPMVQD
ncbi:MAG TPA: nuclear transport factor 2 family protein [Polyangiaceae bacterium]|nr:nuclear transport factor 2 family protein [Polyangiaceae bacterium]